MAKQHAEHFIIIQDKCAHEHMYKSHLMTIINLVDWIDDGLLVRFFILSFISVIFTVIKYALISENSKNKH